MAFSKYAIVNAGLIFFSLAVMSTAIFGRWICGWACHLVAVQDFSRWLLARLHIRPKPLRSRLLGAVPTVAFAYMFLVPLLYRAWEYFSGNSQATAPWAVASVRLTTNDMWATFPGWLTSGVILVFCGFLIIYLLGAKGFCTNACPYGAIFGLADQFAPLRVRVTSACEGCGHCTAACTSNVRVHEEVRRFGRIVDPGCMKCLDCVSVCPKNALYYGWQRADEPARAAGPVRPGFWLRLRAAAPTTLFAGAALTLFAGFDIQFLFQWVDVAIIGGLTVAIGLLLMALGGSTEARRAAEWDEEWFLAATFLLGVFAFRRLYGEVSFLFALGLAVCAAFLATKFLLLATRRELSLRSWRLKARGRFFPAALGLAGLMLPLGGVWVYSGVQQVRLIQLDRARAELAHLQRGPRTPATQQRLEELYGGLMEANAADVDLLLQAAMLALEQGKPDLARSRLEAGLARYPQEARFYLNLGVLDAEQGQMDRALQRFHQAVERGPKLVPPRLYLAQSLCEVERYEDGLRAYDDVLALDPNQVDALFNSGLVLAELGRNAEAVARLEQAQRVRPDLAEIRAALGQIRDAKP